MKKLLFICLVLLSIICLTKTNNVQASNTTYSDNLKGQWTPEQVNETTMYGMTHQSVWGKANSNDPQHINVLSMKTDGYSSKLVTWSVLSSDNRKYTRQNLDVIAKDYEEKHPGWIVIGGINGDQYTTGYGSDIGAGSAYFTPQTYYPLIMDGESRIPYTVLNNWNMHVGFANDGSTDSLIDASPITGYKIKIVDEYKNEISSFDVDLINEKPSENETTVWSTYISIVNPEYVAKELSSNNDIYIIEKPELAYMNNCKEYGGVNSFFGKGTITKLEKEYILRSNQFAIETNNEELKNALSIGTRVIVEANYQDEALNKVEASTGYHSVHRYNNEDQELVHTSYDGNRYSRAIIGQKADGTYVLLTVDLATDPNDLMIRYKGMGFDECNATLKHYGVVEAYQMDGGGSVTSILRNADGGFDITNYPRDGVRANMTGLLFVVRSSELEVSNETNYHSVTLTQNKVENVGSIVENIKVTYNDKEYTLNNGKIVIDGLEENKEYIFDYTYDVVSNDGTRTTYSSQIKTKTAEYNEIKADFKILSVGKSKATLTNESPSEIQNIKVDIGGYEYNFTDTTLTMTELISETTYQIKIEYDILDPITGNTYHRTDESIEITTLAVELPEIVKFELYRTTSSRAIFNFECTDEDSILESIVFIYGEKEQTVTNKRGNITVNELNLDSEEYICSLKVTYIIDGTTYNIYSEEITIGTKIETPVEIKHSITYNLDGGVNEENAPTEYVEGVGLNIFPTPTKVGYNFLGWYINEELVTSITSEEKADITLTAKWEKIKVYYTVTIDGESYQVEEGTKVTKPTNPEKSGYTFKGWFIGDTEYNFEQGVTSDLVIESKWEEIKVEETPTQDPTPTPSEEPKKGCGCGKSMGELIMLSTMLSLVAILIRKRK